MTRETKLFLSFFMWILFLFMWLFTKSVTIAALFLVIWISWRNVVRRNYAKERGVKNFETLFRDFRFKLFTGSMWG